MDADWKRKTQKNGGGQRMCQEINNWWQMTKWNRKKEGSEVRKKGKTGRRSEGRERGKWWQEGGRDAEDGGRGREASSSHLFVRASRTMMGGGGTERWEERCQSWVTKFRARICIVEGSGGYGEEVGGEEGNEPTNGCLHVASPSGDERSST